MIAISDLGEAQKKKNTASMNAGRTNFSKPRQN